MPKYQVNAVAVVSYEADGDSPADAARNAQRVICTGGFRLCEVREATATEITLEQIADRTNLKMWLEVEAIRKGGSVDEADGHMAGVRILSDEEIATYARAELFAPFDLGLAGLAVVERVRRWQPIAFAEIKHDMPCRALSVARSWRGEIGKYAPRPLREPELDLLSDIRKRAMIVDAHPWMQRQKETVSVEVRWHEVACPGCKAKIVRAAALVTAPWADRKLSREYAL